MLDRTCSGPLSTDVLDHDKSLLLAFSIYNSWNSGDKRRVLWSIQFRK